MEKSGRMDNEDVTDIPSSKQPSTNAIRSMYCCVLSEVVVVKLLPSDLQFYVCQPCHAKRAGLLALTSLGRDLIMPLNSLY